jgi:hypothetical protein
MEAIRESVEDYEYLVILRNAVEKAKAIRRGDRAFRRAEQLLATGCDEVLAAPGATQIRWEVPKDRGKADLIRVQILESLAALSDPLPKGTPTGR